jgi:hypothetical protein
VTVQHWEADAPTIARCPCGGPLRLVEDHGPAVPLEAQCERCCELTGVAHGLAKAGAACTATPDVIPGSVQDFGF